MKETLHLDEEWQKAIKKKDPNFEGSAYQEMGYDNAICPTCGAHLRAGICLMNTCHLTKTSRERFACLMKDYFLNKGGNE